MENLWRAAGELKEEEPAFVSVTYGAGGSTRDRTIGIVKRIKQELGLEAMAHFTCVGATVDELRGTLDEMRDAGIENVLALRGDPPQGEDRVDRDPGRAQLLDRADRADRRPSTTSSIGAACFPEVHPQATDMDSDIRFLKKKVEAGAQLPDHAALLRQRLYFDFVEKARAAGIEVPIIPGIMPVTNYAQIKRFTEMCGASMPARARGRAGRPARTSPRPCASSAWRTRRCSAPTCLTAARRASTSTC